MLTLPIDTPRLRLRRFTDADLEPFLAYRRLESVYRYQGWPRPYTRALAQTLVADMRAGPVLRPGAWSQIVIATRSTNALIGDIGTHTSEGQPRVHKLGFTLAPAHQRQGFAREALTAWIDNLCAGAEVEAFLAVADQRNLASRALLKRLGFALHEQREAEYFGEPCVDEHYLLHPGPPAGSTPHPTRG